MSLGAPPECPDCPSLHRVFQVRLVSQCREETLAKSLTPHGHKRRVIGLPWLHRQSMWPITFNGDKTSVTPPTTTWYEVLGTQDHQFAFRQCPELFTRRNLQDVRRRTIWKSDTTKRIECHNNLKRWCCCPYYSTPAIAILT